jgi:hypothetical protein
VSKEDLDKRLQITASALRVNMVRFDGVDLLKEYDLIKEKKSKLASIVRAVIELTVDGYLRSQENKGDSDESHR